MALNEVLKKIIEQQLSLSLKKEVTIDRIRRVSGGDISDCFKLYTNEKPYFLKCSPDHPYPDMFAKELSGLQLLKEKTNMAIPEPLFTGRADKTIFLVLEFIKKEPPQQDFWQIFAQNLVQVHQQSSSAFGLSTDNYIGSLPQSNTLHTSWASFYGNERIQPLVKKCVDNKLLSTSVIASSDALCQKLDTIFPEEKPALLHGDLWGGNYLAGPHSQPYLFDPAVYYGSREMDLAMSRLFGGFDRKFYWYYEDYFPLAKDWQKRISLCQLYPLLVHALLFGGGYVQQVKNILSAF